MLRICVVVEPRLTLVLLGTEAGGCPPDFVTDVRPLASLFEVSGKELFVLSIFMELTL
jgi:hypothetical protein